MRMKFLNMNNEELAEQLKEYGKQRKGELSEMTYAAGIKLASLQRVYDELVDKKIDLERKIDNVAELMCDKYCKYPNECADDEELMGICEKCPLGGTND